MVDDGVEVGLQPAHELLVRDFAVEHPEIVRGVIEILARRDRFVTAEETHVCGDDRGKLRDELQGGVAIVTRRNRGDAHAQRVHRVDVSARRIAQECERGTGQTSS